MNQNYFSFRYLAVMRFFLLHGNCNELVHQYGNLVHSLIEQFWACKIPPSLAAFVLEIYAYKLI